MSIPVIAVELTPSQVEFLVSVCSDYIETMDENKIGDSYSRALVNGAKTRLQDAFNRS